MAEMAAVPANDSAGREKFYTVVDRQAQLSALAVGGHVPGLLVKMEGH